MCTKFRSIFRAGSSHQVLKVSNLRWRPSAQVESSDPRGEGQLVEVISRFCLSLFQLEPHLLVQALEVLILLFSHDLASHCSIHRGLALFQLLEGLECFSSSCPRSSLRMEWSSWSSACSASNFLNSSESLASLASVLS
jgi:hypothetical protein